MDYNIEALYGVFIIMNFMMTVFGLNTFLFKTLTSLQAEKLTLLLKFTLPISVFSFIWYIVDSINGALESDIIYIGNIEILFWLLLLAALIFLTLKIFNWKEKNEQ
ncbi:MAG TPA: hypothetical protein PKU71_02585 [bacterium]|nr:hypothetical protein [bacterium]HND76096.1 hypothetical protein [bacterium]HNH28289.1 hypothetical protein [bacterium]